MGGVAPAVAVSGNAGPERGPLALLLALLALVALTALATWLVRLLG